MIWFFMRLYLALLQEPLQYKAWNLKLVLYKAKGTIITLE